MKPLITRSALLGLALTTLAPAADSPAPEKKPEAGPTQASAADPALEAKRKEQEALSTENKLQSERLTQETNAMRAEITRLKMERDLLNERQAYEAAKRQLSHKDELTKLNEEKERLMQESDLSKARAEKLANDLKSMQTESSLEITKLQNEITRIETEEKRDAYADSKPQYLKKPLREDGTLVISDRRIPLNGPITGSTADFVTNRIQYWNNKDREMPIFIVIDASPGGSVMAGYRILKAMESSQAPVHVVVKSFAASMAAGIATLAKESYAYPNAIILHHQISSPVMATLNLTQQREFHEESMRWWERLGTPVAAKMGIAPDELVKRMYSHNSSGDWSEFATEAQKLKWVNHIVQGIDETSIIKDPDASSTPAVMPTRPSPLAEELDSNGKPVVWLPRLDPMDVYFLHNPDGYYRTR